MNSATMDLLHAQAYLVSLTVVLFAYYFYIVSKEKQTSRSSSNYSAYSEGDVKSVLTTHIVFSLYIAHHNRWSVFIFYYSIAILIATNMTYLSKRSVFLVSLSDNEIRSMLRPLHDTLIISSNIYTVGALYAYSCNEPYLAFLSFGTTVTSYLYHRYREGIFFNIDNVFACSLMSCFMWTVFLSYFSNCEEYFYFGIVGIPAVCFMLHACGMPAVISIDKLTGCCVRTSSDSYNILHFFWHLVSATGPVLCSYYLYYCHDSDGHNLDQSKVIGSDVYLIHSEKHGIRYFPMVPTLALLSGLLLNLLLNYFGITPYD